MNFKFKKKKVVWSIIISILGSTLFWYLTSLSAIYKAGTSNISKDIGVLSSLSPLQSVILYLAIIFVIIYIGWFIVVYVIWSLLERK